MPKKKKKRGTAQAQAAANDTAPIDHLLSAKQHGVASDGLLHQFREQQELRQARGGGSRDSDTPLLGLAGNAVMHRNMELQDIVRHAATGDVSTEEGRGVLWTGDKRSGPKNETVEVSAMRTAQNFAKKTGRRTVEMTEGGGAMDRYTREGGDSYGDLVNDRFNYLRNGENTDDVWKDTWGREDQLAYGPQNKGKAAPKAFGAKQLMDSALNGLGGGIEDLDGHQTDAKKNPAANVWDIISKRFAGGLSGETYAVHGYDEADHEHMTKNVLAGNTFNGIEKPLVEEKKKAILKETFGDTLEMEEYLKG